MMESARDNTQHIDEGDIIRLLDGECHAEEAARLQAHLVSCTTCRTVQDELTDLSTNFGAFVRHGDVERASHPPQPGPVAGSLPTRRPLYARPGLLRAAAVLLAIVATVLAVPPARAWLVNQWASLVGRSDVTPQENAIVGADSIPTTSSRVSFVPGSGDFVIDFASFQEAGTLLLLIEDANTASAGAVEGQADGIIVRQNGFLIASATTSITSYRVQVPDYLRRVTVRIAGADVASYVIADSAGRRWEISLRRR